MIYTRRDRGLPRARFKPLDFSGAGEPSLYGTPHARWGADRDPATLADPADPTRVVQWSLSETRDPFGNLIRYSYLQDTHHETGDLRAWEQLYLDTVQYVDHGDPQDPDFLVRVAFDYEERPDPFSSFRSGFEVRTTRRCTAIRVFSAEVGTTPIKEHLFVYAPDDALHCGASLLQEVILRGRDNNETQELPPLTFGYSDFAPQKQRSTPHSTTTSRWE